MTELEDLIASQSQDLKSGNYQRPEPIVAFSLDGRLFEETEEVLVKSDKHLAMPSCGHDRVCLSLRGDGRVRCSQCDRQRNNTDRHRRAAREWYRKNRAKTCHE